MKHEHKNAEPSTPNGPRILFLIDEMTAITAGGTERQLLQLVGIALRNGMRPTICVLRGTGWLTPQIAQCPVMHFDIKALKTWDGLVSLYRLARWMRSQAFTILQPFFSESNLVAPWLGKIAGIPIILGTRRNLSHIVDDGIGRGAQRWQSVTNLLVDEILVNSQAVAQNTARNERFCGDKLNVVYNGIELGGFPLDAAWRQQIRTSLGIQPNEVLVGNISGLRAVKGVELFVEVAALLHSLEPRFRFVLVGDGELRVRLEDRIRELRLSEVFHLAGAAEAVQPYLAAFDIAVLCSRAEGFSNSLLEYMAAGLPCIATDVGGNREALSGAGILVPAEDPAALRDAVLSLSEPAARATLGSAAAQAVKRFDVSVAEKQMGEIFRRHLHNKNASKS